MSQSSDPPGDETDESHYGYGSHSFPPSTPNHVHPYPNQGFTPTPIHFYPPSREQPGIPGTFVYHPQQHPYYISSPVLNLASTPPTLTNAEKLAIAFVGEFFNGIMPETSSRPQSRLVFQWPIHKKSVMAEHRLLVIIRAIRKAGFPTIGSFLAALFQDKYSEASLCTSVASFLRGQEKDPAHHPVAIVQLIFRHSKSQEWNSPGVAQEPSFSLPRHALRPSLRLDCSLVPPGSNSTRNGLTDWALKSFSRGLIRPEHGFVRLPKMEAWSWQKILSSGLQLRSTRGARKRLEKACDIPVAPVTAPDSSQSEPEVASSVTGEHQEDSQFEQPEPELDAGSDEEEEDLEESDPTLSNPNLMSSKIGRRDPWQAVTASILVLLYFRYRFTLVFPMLIGLFAFTCNANRELVALLCRLGLTVSYRVTLATLSVLAGDSDAQLRLLGAFPDDLGPQFLMLFDNVNKMQRAWQATLGHKDEVKSGTASTIIELEDVPAGAMLSEPLVEKIKQKVRLGLTVKELEADIDWEHIRGIGAATVLRIWLKYIPSLSHHRTTVEELLTTKHAKHRLRLRKSKIHTARPTNIDESTTVGVASVLQNLVGQLFILPMSLFKWMVMICGDQLSIDRIRKIIRYAGKAGTSYEQHKWALPVIQLWHLKWAWQKAIFRLHWYPSLEKGTFGLHHDCVAMEREKFNHEKCDFYPAHHILEDCFECMVLDALRLICEQKTSVITPSNMKLIDALSTYFVPTADDAEGHLDRDTSVYGEPWCGATVDADPESAIGSSLVLLYGSAHNILTAAATTSRSKPKRIRTTANAQPARNFSSGDQAMITLCHFMRVTLWYIELCAATAEGDIGRVFEVLKLLLFSFWGAGSTNYGNELLELACNFLYEYSDALKIAVLNNYLVNLSGRVGHWLPLDLLQEHFNFWIKRLFNSKSHEFDSKHLSERVGLNIGGISDLREKFPGLFRLNRNGQRHTDATTIHDINQLGFHFRRNHILEYEAGRNQPYVVSNEFGAGHSKLLSGQLATF
ncbi:hypothetical protein B0H14DRAFT_2613252 [Mycena olivaceomarginata]|nr:hypothetical protein B0H14DRAFT_2613252 [Mycena olivaceomarginata]